MIEHLRGPATAADAVVDGLVRGPRRAPGGDVDPATGELALSWRDLDLAGALPLRLTRRYGSAYRHGRWFGPGWASWLDEHLELAARQVTLCTADGRVVRYPAPEPGARVFPEHGPHWALAWDGAPGGACAVADPRRGVIRYFGAPAGVRPTAGADGLVLPLLAVADRHGNQIDVVYDAGGAPAEIWHSGGYRVAVATDGGRVVGLTLLGADPDTLMPDDVKALGLSRFAYDDGGRLVAETAPDGSARRFRYDDRGLLLSWTDRVGAVRTYDYDDERRCVHATGEYAAEERRYAYDDAACVTTVSDAQGRAWAFAVDEHRSVVAVTSPLGAGTRRSWDDRGRLTGTTDPLGRTTRFGYEAGDTAVELIRADGSKAVMDLDGSGEPLRVVAPDGGLWEYERDERGMPVVMTDPADGQTRFGYDAHGRLVSWQAPDGRTRTAEYDRAGLVTAYRDGHGASTRVERDAFGRTVRITYANGEARTARWSVDGLLLADAGEEWTYDAEGRLTGHRDAAGGETAFEAGPFGRPAAHTAPDGVRRVFGYDADLRLTSVAASDGGTRSLRYDAAGRLAAARAEDGTETAYEYDALDRVAAVVRDGSRDVRHHDALGRVVSRVTPSGAALTWTYDAFGRPEELRCGPHTVEYAYGADGRETERRLGEVTVVHERDPAGRIVTQTVRHGTPVDAVTAALNPSLGPREVWRRTYAHDGGRWSVTDETPVAVVESEPGTDGERFRVVVRDPSGGPVAVVAPDGTVTGPGEFDDCLDLPEQPYGERRLVAHPHTSLDRYVPPGPGAADLP
ncbi:DUF6531 domain-containing protein [Yinghuangia seranimata]|uniref:DUF6531 domain-containing protein n=1 Tax=Yinghuangia seranimata TaxID=408067 RepID=UPI00248D2201|nr:DUF6531 domain-containing protein [Yinghuangia seranimata]MDI2128507.1 DUF6531 domain-containing protein [Yinghuangia seranimata]